MLRIGPTLSIDEDEIEEHFILAGGPGGQHVNKASTAVQLRFDAAHTQSLSAPICKRLIRLAGRRVNKDGVWVITAHRHRSQAANRRDARARLADLVRAAAVPPKPRRKTAIPGSVKARRLESKRQRSVIKRKRMIPRGDFD